MQIRKVLTIGGSDPSGGAGIQADIFSLLELGIFPFSVITSVTAQNSSGIMTIHNVSHQIVGDQIRAILTDVGPDAAKIGMVGTRENVKTIAEIFEDYGVENLVVDPIIEATDGTTLLGPSGFSLMKVRLFPLAKVVTPNIPEAQKLSGFSIKDVEDMRRAAQAIHLFGSEWILIKGGHLEGEKCMDILWNGTTYYEYTSEKVESDVRGTGCVFSSALAAHLAQGIEVPKAVELAEEYVLQKIKSAYLIGKGGPQILPIAIKR